jgi:hypothetical protein
MDVHPVNASEAITKQTVQPVDRADCGEAETTAEETGALSMGGSPSAPFQKPEFETQS